MMKNNKKAFTLAEVLITLTVIGIVAAISLPALMQNVNERAWDAKRKTLHVRMTNAILDMPKVKGYGEYKVETVDGNQVTTDTAAETFLNELSKVYKIKNICDSNHLSSCGVPNKFFNLQGNATSLPKDLTIFNGNGEFPAIKSVSFETENGEKIALYYNPFCRPYRESDATLSARNVICAHMIYDLNGPDEPNKIGKDMGIMSVIYSPKGLEVVAPNLYYKSVGNAPQYSEDGVDAMTLCKNKDSKFTLPTIAEVISISSTSAFTGFGCSLVSGTIKTAGKDGTVWGVDYSNFCKFGTAKPIPRVAERPIVCIKE